MMPCAVFFRDHLRSYGRIDLLGSGRGRVDGLGDAFDSFGGIYDPVLGLLISLGFDVELVQEGLNIVLILDG